VKRAINSYITFTAKERMGILALALVLLLLIAWRLLLPIMVQPRLQPSVVQRANLAVPDTIAAKDTTDEDPQLTAIIDVNKADSTTLLLIPNIGPAKAHAALQWRRNEGQFYSTEHFRQVVQLPLEQFNNIKQQLIAQHD
jgi:DNA uptake protein ComE-like DNA-binding protein